MGGTQRGSYRFGAGDRLAPVLPIVLCIGESRWSAPARVIELVTPGASGEGKRDEGVASRAGALFAGDGYLLLDTRRLGPEDLRHDNAAALLAGLENLELETAEELFGAFHKCVNAPELQELREVMLGWASRQARRRLGVDHRLRDGRRVDRPLRQWHQPLMSFHSPNPQLHETSICGEAPPVALVPRVVPQVICVQVQIEVFRGARPNVQQPWVEHPGRVQRSKYSQIRVRSRELVRNPG